MSPSFQVRVRIGVAPRLPDFPFADEELGRALEARLLARVARGPMAPTAILLRRDKAQIIDMIPLLQRRSDVHRLLAALAGQEGIEAMAVAGMMTLRRKGVPIQRFACAFVEWADGRWWGAWHPLDDNGRLVPTDMDDIRRAVDGQPRPSGLGAWFSRARFEGLRAELRTNIGAPEAEPEPVN